MEVDIPTPSNNYTIKKIETEVGTENLTQQRVKIFLKANQREIQIDDLKHIIVEGSVKVSNATSIEINQNRTDSRRNVIKIKVPYFYVKENLTLVSSEKHQLKHVLNSLSLVL